MLWIQKTLWINHAESVYINDILVLKHGYNNDENEDMIMAFKIEEGTPTCQVGSVSSSYIGEESVSFSNQNNTSNPCW